MVTTERSSPNGKKPPSATALFVGRLCLLFVLLWFVAALFGDFIAWGILGTPHILSPHFAKLEAQIHSVGSVLLPVSFFGLDRGFEKLQQRQWKHLLIAFLFIIVADVPLARGCAILAHAAQIKGLVVFTHHKAVVACLITLAVLACKIKVMASVLALIRPAFEPEPVPRFTIASE